MMEANTLKQMRRQLAHIFAMYGDQPDELMRKLETLLIEWFDKGLNAREGINLLCPHCNQVSTVYHFEWDAITCWFCKRDVELKEWVKQ